MSASSQSRTPKRRGPDLQYRLTESFAPCAFVTACRPAISFALSPACGVQMAWGCDMGMIVSRQQ